jgi:hypothetical protein
VDFSLDGMFKNLELSWDLRADSSGQISSLKLPKVGFQRMKAGSFAAAALSLSIFKSGPSATPSANALGIPTACSNKKHFK